MTGRRAGESIDPPPGGAVAASAGPAGRPGPLWLARYNLGQGRADAIAGLTLAAYMLPAAIGDASLARLPPEAGLYACIFSGLVFGWLCSSRHTAVTVTSAISLLMGTSLGALAAGGGEGAAEEGRYAALAACTALLVAALAFGAWLIRAGSLVNFVSETVLIGFKAGVALTLASTQLPKLFGISGAHGGFWECSSHFVHHLGDTNGASLAIGLAALGALALGKVFLKNKPVALFVVIGGIVAAGVMGLDARGVKMLGEVPRGLPPIGLPAVKWDDLNELLPLAMACFLLAAVETSAIGRMFASKHGGRLDANRELLAVAGANLAAGLGKGFPVSGGMSQSLVNESAGARTPASGLVAAGLMLVVAVFFTEMLRNLPQPVLAAIVLMAVVGLVNVRAIAHLWKTDKPELLIAAAALAGVLASGLLRGVLIGAVISMLLLIRRASRPHVAFLGRIPGTRRYSDIERHPDNEPVGGVIIFRPEGSLVYFNADHVRDAVLEKVRGTRDVHAVVCDLSASPHVDLAGAEMLKALDTELRALGGGGAGGARLRIVEARSSVRERLRVQGVEERTGPVDRFTSVADAVDAAERGPGTGVDAQSSEAAITRMCGETGGRIMADAAPLAQRIKAEFDSRDQRLKSAEQDRAKESEQHEKRLALFTTTCEGLKAVWRPRFEEFAKQFGEKVKVIPSVTPSQREAKVQFLTDLANVTLRLTVAPSPDVSKLVLDYDLLIIPIYFDYDRHARLEMPLDKIDKDAVGKWIDDQLVSCVKAYLSIQDNEHYIKRAMVEDPISKARFLKEDAKAKLEHDGRTVYFGSEDSLRQYKQRHQIDQPAEPPKQAAEAGASPSPAPPPGSAAAGPAVVTKVGQSRQEQPKP